jgi:hypothetical protein
MLSRNIRELQRDEVEESHYGFLNISENTLVSNDCDFTSYLHTMQDGNWQHANNHDITGLAGPPHLPAC